MGWIPVKLWHHLTLQNLKTLIFLLFSQYWGGSKKSRWSPHFSKQSIPVLFYSKPHRKVSAGELSVCDKFRKLLKTKSTKHFAKPDFWVKFGFSKTRVSSPVAPRGVHISRNDPPSQNRCFWKYKLSRGATGDETRVFGNPDFCQKSRFENGLVDLFWCFFVTCRKPVIQWH